MVKFRRFFKKYWYVLLILILIFIVCMSLFVYIAWKLKKIDDISSWGSIISGTLTYFGASFLGVFVFYNSWQQIERDKVHKRILYDLEMLADYDEENGFFIPLSFEKIPKTHIKNQGLVTNTAAGPKDLNYFGLRLTNLGKTSIKKINILNFYFTKDKKIIKDYIYYTFSDWNQNYLLEYKELACIYIGLDKKIFPEKYYIQKKNMLFFMQIDLTDEYGEKTVEFMGVVLGKSLGKVSTQKMTIEKYKEIVRRKKEILLWDENYNNFE